MRREGLGTDGWSPSKHYFEDNFSRSDSIGGAHGVGDRSGPRRRRGALGVVFHLRFVVDAHS